MYQACPLFQELYLLRHSFNSLSSFWNFNWISVVFSSRNLEELKNAILYLLWYVAASTASFFGFPTVTFQCVPCLFPWYTPFGIIQAFKGRLNAGLVLLPVEVIFFLGLSINFQMFWQLRLHSVALQVNKPELCSWVLAALSCVRTWKCAPGGKNI